MACAAHGLGLNQFGDISYLLDFTFTSSTMSLPRRCSANPLAVSARKRMLPSRMRNVWLMSPEVVGPGGITVASRTQFWNGRCFASTLLK
jgi:hypothetical protein